MYFRCIYVSLTSATSCFMRFLILWLMCALMFKSSTEVLTMVLHALESTHAVLVIMTQQDMPKQLYKEEVCSNCSAEMVLVDVNM